MKIKILSVGKTKEEWLENAFQEYIKRLKGTTEIECAWAKTDTQLIEWAKKERAVICLDPQGSLYTSEQFSKFLMRQLEANGAKSTFIIGGADGLPVDVKKQGPAISLSPLTFTHQITRLVLLEQIYRAFEIDKGSKYHK